MDINKENILPRGTSKSSWPMTRKSSIIQQTYAYFYASPITIFLQPHIKSENLNYITRLRSLYAQTEAVKEAVRERTHSKQQHQQRRAPSGQPPADCPTAQRPEAGWCDVFVGSGQPPHRRAAGQPRGT